MTKPLPQMNTTLQPTQREQATPTVPPPPRVIVKDDFSTEHLGEAERTDFSDTI